MPRVVQFDSHGDPEVLHIVDRALETPGPGDVRLNVEAIGINRLDELARQGNAPRPIHLPGARLGIEATGVVDDVGSEVTDFKVGDAVIVTAVPQYDINGTYADSLVLPASSLIARPAGVDPVSAAALWVGHSTAYGAIIEKARLRPGDHLLVTAATSGVGLAAIQIANQIGAIPIAVTRHTRKKDALLAAGAAAVIATDTDELVDSVYASTDGAGADVVLDLVGGPGFIEVADAARFVTGTVVIAGKLDSRPTPMPNRPLTIRKHMSFSLMSDPVAVRRIAAFLAAGLRTGVISPVVDAVYSLDHVVAAHRHLGRGDLFGKLVITT